MAQVEFKVSTEQLLNTASEFSGTGAAISNLTQEMVNISTQLSSCSSESTQTFISKLTSLEPSIQKMNAMSQEHVSDLQRIVEEYNQAESANLEQAQALRTDIIS